MHRLSHEELLESLALQKAEALGPYNRWLAGERLGHSPTDEEALDHYFNHKGAEHHRIIEEEAYSRGSTERTEGEVEPSDHTHPGTP